MIITLGYLQVLTYKYERTSEEVNNAKGLWVPAYDPFLKKTEISAPKVMEDIPLRSKYEKNCLRNLKEKRDQLFPILRMDEWNLLMAYFDFTDRLGHVYGGNRLKMVEVYTIADKLVKDIKDNLKKFQEDVFFLIVSDHGMEPQGRFGSHTAHGFYSCNFSLNISQPKITMFKEIILEKVEQ